MTAFILVPGAHTGGWVWEEVADRLRRAGAQAYPVTLVGEGADGDGEGVNGGGADGGDLESHVARLVRLIDRVEADDVVLVGHCYGIHPVFAAADRRRERISRIVHVDVGMPRDGRPALDLVPDQGLRERLAAGGDGDGAGRLAAPSRDAWHRWGSLDGVPAGALDRLVREAVPQPLDTLTQPMRLSGAVGELPTTGVLCTGNGPGIETLEALAALGDPALQALTDPRIGFFELATGHWPMLSAPDDLADALLKAAAGGGHRLTPAGEPPHLRPFLLDPPEVRRERSGRVDLYLPDDLDERPGRRPAVVLVHGGPVPEGARPTPRDWPAFTGYGRYVAGLGAVGVTVDHRLHDLTDYPRAAQDVAAAVDLVRADPRVDPDRVALWFFSAGGLLSADWLSAPPAWLRCVAATYPVLAPLPSWGLGGSRFHPARAVTGAGRLPLVLTRVERERPEIARTVTEFLAAAEKCGADVEVVDVPDGTHGFETTDHSEPARRAVDRAVRAVLSHLTA
ncbi:dienelactone hydrolase family protein [Streptomyces ficellus]|uniref:Alpha/beta fold hydrolase n=1 Tax=Streptomyces ficellus TaxID=1977088 RepID=A0A6I6F1H6_9ACTN|nr:dienelactone hydrolase family protein [Streptomyces ficellus]QGV77793.1 alpha/beta fold hydrolase [Streptomyces ficellus]